MASGTLHGSGSPYHRIELDWTSTPIAGENASTVVCILYLANLSDLASIYVGERADTTITIDGTTYTGTAPAQNRTGSGRWELFRASKRVDHNQDGTRSIAVAASYPVRATLAGTYYSELALPSTTITLAKIELAVVTIGDASGTPRRSKGIWIGDASGTPRKAKGIWVGDANGTPRRAR